MSRILHVRKCTFLLLCILGCNSNPGSNSTPADPNKEKRSKVIECVNNFYKCYDAFNSSWNSYRVTKSKKDARKHLIDCKESLGQIRPFEPLGVDPALAGAISEYKNVAVEYVEFCLEDDDRWFPDAAKSSKFRKQHDRALEKVQYETNRVAAELGEITTRKKDDKP